MTDQIAAAKPLRSDAQRNYDAVLRAGEQLLAQHGPDFAFEDVARAAGVGKGTLYRHFATRDHLIAAVLAERFARLAAEADTLYDSAEPGDAVETWLRSFDRLPTRFRGLGARLGDGLADDGSAVSTACRPMKASFNRLLVRAQDAGVVQADVVDAELLSVVASLPAQFRDAEGRSRFLDVILRGIEA
jgi:AcrR family transcriptional regulator